jgi:general secretion pathway protein G
MMVGGLGKSLRQPVRNRAGFTLVELLVVVVILGLLVGLVGPKLFRRADKAKITTAHAQISDFGVALDLYRLDVGRYPDALEALIEDDGAEGPLGE